MFFYNEEGGAEASSQQPVVGDPYFNNVSLLLKMDNDFSDSSIYNHATTVVGTTSISTTQSKYGGASGLWPGNNSYLTIDDHASLQFNDTEDFTIETWIYPLSSATYPAVFGNQAGLKHYGRLSLFYRHANASPNNYYLYTNTSSTNNITLQSSIATVYNEWVHLAVVRKDNILTLYVNGTNAGQIAHNYPVITDASNKFYVGGIGYYPTYHEAHAHMDDFRITKGVARYATDFTPPDSLPTS